MHKPNGEPDSTPTLIRQKDVLRLLGFGWYFAANLGIGISGGYFLDRWLGTEPVLLLLGLLLGTAAGFYGMFKMLMPLYKREAQERAARPGNDE